MTRTAALLLLALAGCGSADAPPPVSENKGASVATPVPAPVPTPDVPAQAVPEPAPPGRGGDTEAQQALDVVKAYFRHIEEGDYPAAWALRWRGEADDEKSRRAFIDNYARYAEHHATIGIPSEVEGAAGSLYVEVPVQLYGRLKSGEPFSSAGTITLRRVNDVPGSTPEQRRWHIYSRD